MAVLSTATGKSLSDAQADVWYDCLKDLKPDRFDEAVVAFIKGGDDWPSVSKLRKLAKQIGIDKAMYPTVRRIEGRKLAGPVSAAIKRIGNVKATEQPAKQAVKAVKNKNTEQQKAELEQWLRERRMADATN
jgi:hypothetical protein